MGGGGGARGGKKTNVNLRRVRNLLPLKKRRGEGEEGDSSWARVRAKILVLGRSRHSGHGPVIFQKELYLCRRKKTAYRRKGGVRQVGSLTNFYQ